MSPFTKKTKLIKNSKSPNVQWNWKKTTALKGTLRRRLSHMFLFLFKTAYIWYDFTMKLMLIHAGGLLAFAARLSVFDVHITVARLTKRLR